MINGWTRRIGKCTISRRVFENVPEWPPPHHKHFTAFFPGPPGWADARREPLDFMVQGKINRGRRTNHPAGHHSIRTKQCPPPSSPHFFTGRMPFLPPNQPCQSTEGNKMCLSDFGENLWKLETAWNIRGNFAAHAGPYVKVSYNH